MNKRRLTFIVIVVLLFSFTPLLSRIVLDYNLVSGFSSFAMPNQAGTLWFMPPNLAGNCPCPDGTQQGDCSNSEMFGQPYYCWSEYDYYNEIDICYLEQDCTICGCPDGKECTGDGYCVVPQQQDDENEEAFTCLDGTVSGMCSLTRPLYCDLSAGELINNCGYCGCSRGYYCSGEGICLIKKNETNSNSTIGVDPNGNGEEKEKPLWKDIDVEHKVSEKGIKVSPKLILKKVSTNEQILNSPGGVVAEQINIKGVDEKIGLEQDELEKIEEEVLEIQDRLQSSDPRVVGSALTPKEEEPQIFDDETFGNVLPDSPPAAALGPPMYSPEVEDIMELECVDEIEGSCLGPYFCCEGMVCTGGICVSNVEVVSLDLEVDEVISNPNRLVLKDTSGFANLVEVGFKKPGSGHGVKVIKYETHPNFVDTLAVPDGVSFGFYDIDAENVEEGDGATMSFEILNELLVLNQVENLGLYRYTSDEHWESLDLIGISSDNEKTRFTFESPGFSYFEILGEKDQLLSAGAIGVDDDSSSLWAIYTSSVTPGFSLLEVMFGYNDRLLFGNLFGQPFIDLYLDSYI